MPANSLLCLSIFLALNIPVNSQSFLTHQLNHSRVDAAKAEKQVTLEKVFEQTGLSFPPREIFFRAFKMEQQFEVWAKGDDGQFVLVKTYPICKLSGKLGPKRKQGDLQIPEGFYHIETFNPASRFHLSLRINYPNESDKVLSHAAKPGGDIYVHGDCVTIGCIPLTDDFIKEVYWLAVLAKANGQNKIPIHIFPAKLTGENMNTLEHLYGDSDLLTFWKNLEQGFSYFEKHRRLPVISVTNNGKYRVIEK